MKIGKYTVGNYVVTNEGNKKKLVFDCRNCVYNTSVSDDPRCRYHIMKVLETVDADEVILADVYERVYGEEQTKYLKEMVNLLLSFENRAIWVASHLGVKEVDCDDCYPERHNIILKFARDLLSFDPIASYVALLKEIENNKSRVGESDGQPCNVCFKANLKHLLNIKEEYDKTKFIKAVKPLLLRSADLTDLADIYRALFEVEIKPAFIGSRVNFEDMDKLQLIDEYMVLNTQVQIFRHPDKIEYQYIINPPEYTLSPDHYFVLTKTKETVANYQPGKVTLTTGTSTKKYFERIYMSTITDIARRYNINLSPEDIEALSEIVTRYTIGYGILELLLSDKRLTDIYLDSPLGSKAIYLVHSQYGQCQTNINYTEKDAESFVGKIRAMSGRPFDDAHPILDYDLADLNTRIAIIGKPLSTDGIAFAFRLHKETPWTLPQLIKVKSMSPLAAGMLSFFVNNNCTILVAGSRGAGKTSLMTALMLEILQNARVIVQEDTLELPIEYMREIGYNIQRLKTRSAIGAGEESAEVAPEDALRTALRLGDSALIVGEVRSVEAKVLYEAMRIGAAGNVVMGTIHADSAYAVWDRVVNDLGVPTTSFKATDLVVVGKPIRFKGSLKSHRRIVQITEVRKHWNKDPDAEGGLLNIMEYEAGKDTLILNEDALKDSELFSKICRLSGMGIEEVWDNIKMLATEKEFQVNVSNEMECPQLLEAENTAFAHNKLLLVKEDYLSEIGKIDYLKVTETWKAWYKESFAPKIVKRVNEEKKENKDIDKD